MAKHTVPMPAEMYHEPTPRQEADYAIDRAAAKAALAHPKTQKLQEMIKQRMLKAAGNADENGAGAGGKGASKGKKKK